MPSRKNTTVEYAVPSERETEEAKVSSRMLSPRVQRNRPLSLRVVDEQSAEGEQVITLPAQAARLLLDILAHMAEGKAVTVLPADAELTTQQAADLLRVSRPFVVQLLEQAHIPFRKIGTHRRVLVRDVLAYQERSTAAREQSLDDLAALSQELDVGY